jgi:transposase
MCEHIWRPSRIGFDRAVTIMVDLTRDQAGCLHARLLDAVVGRSGTVYRGWLDAQPDGFVDGVETAALDLFRGYANAIRDGLSDAVAVLDAFHVVRLAPRSSRRSAAASSKTPWATAVTRTTRCIRSAGSSATRAVDASAPSIETTETGPMPGTPPPRR